MANGHGSPGRGLNLMKKILLLIILIFFKNPAYSERYTCTFLDKNQQIRTFSETRTGNKFVDTLGNIQSKIKENDNIIILYNVTITEEMGIVHSTIITKSDLKFAKTITALETEGSINFPQRIQSKSINGACTVTM
tara:strand:+ start:229 stop:636 length:408 start_codon:yes stop_codon:yes gene_type:complete